MSTKRRRPSTIEDTVKSHTKRIKFTLDSAHLPSTSTNGAVLVTGAGDVGQLGLGPDILEKKRPALVNLDYEIVDICAGGMHTVCLTETGKVLTFGCNDEGALGRNTAIKEESESFPDVVELPGKAVQISAGDSHTAALLEDGRVFAWGTFRDSHGNMGMTLNGNEKLPYELLPGECIMKIASGADHLVFLTKHGEVYTCGCAEQGQLGRITSRGSDRNARLNNGAMPLDKLLAPALITPKLSLKLRFDDIWAGNYCTFVKVAHKKDIYVFGLNNYYQIGLKSIEPLYFPKLSKEFSKYEWTDICSAQHHTIALSKEGKVYAIGRHDYGRLGLGKDCEETKELTEIPFFANKKVTSIGCGSCTSFAITEDGELYGWGMGSEGQLGIGEEEDCFEPTIIKCKQLADKKVFRAKGGGQHTVILAYTPTVNNNKVHSNSEVTISA